MIHWLVRLLLLSQKVKKIDRSRCVCVGWGLSVDRGWTWTPLPTRVWRYRVYHAKLDIRKPWHSASESAKIILKKDSKST